VEQSLNVMKFDKHIEIALIFHRLCVDSHNILIILYDNFTGC